MPKITLRRFLLYMLRWQCSTPVLAGVLIWLNGKFSTNSTLDFIIVTIIANAIGAALFFWIDRYIFGQRIVHPLWEIKGGICRKCASIESRVYRLVKAKNYDRMDDKDPTFLCLNCSMKKVKELRDRGVVV